MRLTRSPNYKWIILAMAFFGMLAALGMGRFGYSAILPSMQKGLGLNNTEAGSLASWNLGGYVIMAAIGGFLASRFGPRKVVAVGLAVTAVGMLSTGLASSLASASAGSFVHRSGERARPCPLGGNDVDLVRA